MKSRTGTAAQLSKFLLLALFLALAPAALASSTWYVDGVNGNDINDCLSSQTACKTIAHAISLAKSGHSIMVAPATYTENLTIAFRVNIVGASAATTIVDGGKSGTVFAISSAAANVRLAKMTIRNGAADAGGGIKNSGTLTINSSIISGNRATGWAGGGGGINNSGKLTITNSTITGNVATEVASFGGGVNNSGTLTIYTSTISGNYSGNNAMIGGGIFQDGGGTLTINRSSIIGNNGKFGAGIGAASVTTLTINNSTISGNSGSQNGAGIYKWTGAGNGGTVTISNSTISENSATYGGAGIEFVGGDALTLQNTIVANNSGGNCDTGPYGTIITSNGYNLSSDSTCNFTSPGDMNNTDAKLGKLGNHGGRTQTIPLLSGSPAIDAGNPNGCTNGNGNLLKTDQRGWRRPGKYDTGGCDIGAFEVQHD